MLDPLGTYLVISRILYFYMQSASTHMQFCWWNEHSSVCPCKLHSWLVRIFLQIIDSLSMLLSWHVCHSLPACFTDMDPVHCNCLWYTCSTRDSKCPTMNFSRLTSFHLWNTTLWSRLDGFTTWYVIHGSYRPRQLHCYTQVCASMFTESGLQPCHLHCHSSAMNGLQMYVLCISYQKPFHI